MTLDWMVLAPLALVSYLLGSIPTAIWISRAFFNDDVRNHGSGNAGSTNMYRAFGAKAGVPTQIIDIGKAALSASLPLIIPMLGWAVAAEDSLGLLVAQLICGVAAVLGHVYTVFAGFKGGKGVNCMLGMMLAIAPLGSLVAIGAFLLMLFTVRMVSVGSMLGVVAFTAYQLVVYLQSGRQPDAVLLGVGALLVVLVVYTHRTNLQRIRNGTESRVSFGR